jgi:hypothetical protein
MGILGGRRRRSTLTGSEQNGDAVAFNDNGLERQQTPDPPPPSVTESPRSFRRELEHDLDEPLNMSDSKGELNKTGGAD